MTPKHFGELTPKKWDELRAVNEERAARRQARMDKHMREVKVWVCATLGGSLALAAVCTWLVWHA